MRFLSRDATFTTIKADPGWFVVEFCVGDETTKDGVTYEPVIAWEIIREERDDDDEGHYSVSCVFPLTVEGSDHQISSSGYAIKRPDGTIYFPWSSLYCDEQQAIEIFKKREIEMSERAAKLKSVKKA